MRKIAIEEHFHTEEYLNYLDTRRDYPRLETVKDEKHGTITQRWVAPSVYTVVPQDLTDRLVDTGKGRLREMKEAGIDMQVLSLSFPGVEAFDAADGTTWAKKTNDELAEIVKKCPEKFAGLAVIAPQDPRGASDELERAVKTLGLKGAIINSHIRGEYLDDEKYWIIFETAEKLDVPIYIHPREPSPDMLKPYLAYPGLSGSMWGFAAETGLHAMRLICSGVFDKYPNLKIILGHLGEGLPFWLWRIDIGWQKANLSDMLRKKPSEYVRDNFFVTTSGMFGQPAFLCVYHELGADKILFAVDYPYESTENAVQFIEAAPICDSDKEKICHLNAEKLLGL